MYGTYICHNQTSEWNREECPVFQEEHSCIIFLQGKESTFVSHGLDRKISHRRNVLTSEVIQE